MAYRSDRHRDRQRIRPDEVDQAVGVLDARGVTIGRAHGALWPATDTDLGIVPEKLWVIYLGESREPVPGLWLLRAGRFVAAEGQGG